MDIIILIVITKLVSAIDAIFPNAKNLKPVEIIILATVILSAIVAIFSSINSLLKKSTISDRFNLLMYSFLGGLLGGFTGTIIGFLIACIVYLIIPPGFADIFYFFRLMAFMILCWSIGIIIGGIVTIKPLMKLFFKS